MKYQITMLPKSAPTSSIRLPPALRVRLKKRADAEGRTLSNLIIFLLNKEMNDGNHTPTP